MDKAPLVIDEIDAGREFIKRLNAYQAVKAACWLREADDGERYLYIALEGLTAENVAYGEVMRVTSAMKDHYIDPFRVKLIATTDPIAKAVLDLYRRYPGRMPTRFDGSIFGGTAAAEVYVYPQIR
ncbi:MAG: hypothetical protein HY289_00805 [Planctomycetes bacterium]|nr:hypothetical protein [Planctomycetota bacterium]